MKNKLERPKTYCYFLRSRSGRKDDTDSKEKHARNEPPHRAHFPAKKKFRISSKKSSGFSSKNPSGNKRHAHSRKKWQRLWSSPAGTWASVSRSRSSATVLPLSRSKHKPQEEEKKKTVTPTQSEGAVFRLVHGACWRRKNAPPWLGLVGGEFWAVNQKTAVPRSLTTAPTTRISSWRRRNTSKLYTKRRRVTHIHEELWAAKERKEKESWWVGRGAGGRAGCGIGQRCPCASVWQTVQHGSYQMLNITHIHLTQDTVRGQSFKIVPVINKCCQRKRKESPGGKK